MTALEIRHGVLVEPDSIRVSKFLKTVSTKSGSNRRFDGSWSDLERLAHENFQNNEPGTGSTDGDVLLVNVPAAGFRTNITAITPENISEVESIASTRVDGESAVPQRVIFSTRELPEANFVKLVLYRADVLHQDAGRSTSAEWEIVSINAQPDENTPMHPQTMLRNASQNVGGTYREYTREEWATAESYWADHVFLRRPDRCESDC